MKYRIERENLIYLAALMRKVELSLHRRKNSKDSGLKDYFFDLERDIKGIINLDKSRKAYFLINRYFISQDELDLTLSLLKKFQNYIDDLRLDDKNLMILRLSLTKIRIKLSRRLKRNEVKYVEKIEHYNQNDILDTISLKSLKAI